MACLATVRAMLPVGATAKARKRERSCGMTRTQWKQFLYWAAFTLGAVIVWSALWLRWPQVALAVFFWVVVLLVRGQPR